MKRQLTFTAAFVVLATSAYCLTSWSIAEQPPTLVVQRNRAFSVKHVMITKGSTIRFTNADEFLHQIYVEGRNFSFDSEEQPPGANVDVAFPKAGKYEVRCGIHPKMELDVDVAN